MLLEFILAKDTSEETKVNTYVLIADTDSYDVILGIYFLGVCFGYMDPLTEEFLWRVDCHEIEMVPCRIARLAVKCRGSNHERHNVYTIKVINCALDLHDAMLGDEVDGEDFEYNVNMEIHANKAPMPTTNASSYAYKNLKI